MTDQKTITDSEYKSLNDIRLRKAQLLTDLTKDSNKIADLWNQLMHKPKNKNTPTQRFSGLINTGASVLDGLILGWKLYRKFGGIKTSRSSDKKKFGLFHKRNK